MHLGEQQIQELPERGVLGHPLVAMDVVMAATESRLEHPGLATAQSRHRRDRPALDGLVRKRPVGAGGEGGAEAANLLVQEEEVDPVGPHTVLDLRGGLRAQQRGELVEILARLLEGADLRHGPPALGLRLADHDTAQVLRGVRGAMLEDCDVGLLGRAPLAIRGHWNREVPLHVQSGDPVLVEQGARDPLPDLLVALELDRVAGDEVRDLVLGEGHLGIGLAIGALVPAVIQAELFHLICRPYSHVPSVPRPAPDPGTLLPR